MVEAMYQPDNIAKLRSVLKNKLTKKSEQINNFCTHDGRVFDKRMLVMKTSQWEYQDGKDVIRDEINALKGQFPYIDEALLVYDVENFDWISEFNTAIR
jgi:hypothetical protein